MVKRLVYFFVLPFIYLLSILPFWLLYGVSDLLFFLVFHVLGYRKKVVEDNLKKSFPEKTEIEIKALSRDFFKYLCDLMLETFKTLSISPKTMLEHCYLNQSSIELLNQYYAQDQSVIIVLGHLGNWEWAGNAFSLQCKQQLYVIYHPLSNPYFDGLMIQMRTRFGTKLIAMKDTFREMTKNKEAVTATGFIADQTPPPETAHWTIFMNQETPVFKGTERMAVRFKYPTLYVNVKRIKRGYYEVCIEDQVSQPDQLPEGQLTEWHTQLLEKAIKADPVTWLWSHRRWKHLKK